MRLHSRSMAKKLKNRDIPEPEQKMLWGRAAGRCEFRGCNKALWKSEVTQEGVNIAEKAHIYSVSEGGSRGNADVDEKSLNRAANLMLVCHGCHKTIDHENDGGSYPVERLKTFKREHEERVERVTGFDPGRKSHVVLFGRNIGQVKNPVNYDDAVLGLIDEGRFPATDKPVVLQVKNQEHFDSDEDFWAAQERELARHFERELRPGLAEGEFDRLAVFGLAPMPLLVKLGSFLTDIPSVDVFQLHRNPKGWIWPNDKAQIGLRVERPGNVSGEPVLILSLSATIADDRIVAVLGEGRSIWRVTVATPNQECIRARPALVEFCAVMRALMDEIKGAHGQNSKLHIFPAAPVSAMVELGRLRQPKADMEWVVYDQVKGRGGFVHTLTIG